MVRINVRNSSQVSDGQHTNQVVRRLEMDILADLLGTGSGLLCLGVFVFIAGMGVYIGSFVSGRIREEERQALQSKH